MIAGIDHECRAWGAHKRWLTFGEHGWPERSVLGKLVVEGPGAGEASFIARIPIRDAPPDYAKINLALRKMADTHQMEMPWLVVHAHYVFAGKASVKAPILKISLPQYWRQLHAAHAFMLACVPRESKAYMQESACA